METKTCQNCKKDFRIEAEDFDFYKKINVPAPTWCPDCRLQRRLTWRNERSLYSRPCELCGVGTISLYNPEKKIINYCADCWWSDKWDPFKYGMDYDFSRPFFEQFGELLKKVPHQNLSVSYTTLTNSDFTNMNHYLKECYYLFNSDYDERCLYGEEIEHSNDCVDVTMAEKTEIAYESVNCNKCYETYYSIDCESSNNIWFSKNLVGCSNCFGCVNLRNQQNYIFNEKYTKEEYSKKIKELNSGSHSSVKEIKQKAQELWYKFPNKYMHGIQNLDSTGDYVFNSKYVDKSFIVKDSEYCKYCMWMIVKGNKDCYDYTQFGENAERVYESAVCGKNIYNVIGGNRILDSRDAYYSMFSQNNNSNIFGCVGLRGEHYCILNKQYTKEEYEEILPNIIKHMSDMPYLDKKGRAYVYGDYSPSEISHFDYNETSAQEFFPLVKKEAEDAGFSWKEPKDRDYKITIKPEDLPDNIKDVEDDILKDIIGCEHEGNCKEQCTTAFRITDLELKFYKSHNIPIPRLCPNCRHYQRVLNRNPNKLWHRKCMREGCENEFETSYNPERKEIVYCEKCYQQEVY